MITAAAAIAPSLSHTHTHTHTHTHSEQNKKKTLVPDFAAAMAVQCWNGSQNASLSIPRAWVAISSHNGSHNRVKGHSKVPIKYCNGICQTNQLLLWFRYSNVSINYWIHKPTPPKNQNIGWYVLEWHLANTVTASPREHHATETSVVMIHTKHHFYQAL